MDEKDFRDFAVQFSELYDEKPSESENTPIYLELSELKDMYSGHHEINSGGMKSIQKVFDKATSRYVALAELLPTIDSSFYEIFLKEARLTAILDHPNIISIHDIGVNNAGLPYFTMDLKTEDSLEEILRQLSSGNEKYLKTYSLNHLLSIFSKICDAVSYAHSKNIIHLDLKPANIQVGNFGEVLVCDWGLAKFTNQPDTENIDELLLNHDLLKHVTHSNKVVGTPGYMAPEQIQKKGVHDQITDIYALGCILYSILTYKRPLSGETEQMLKDTLLGEIKPPTQVTENHAPESLNAVVVKAIQVDKNDRYQNVNEFKNEIDKYINGYSTNAENANFLKVLKLFIKRHKVSTTITAMFLLLTLGLTVYFIENLNAEIKEKESQRKKAVELYKNLQQEKELAQSLEAKSSTLQTILSENQLETINLMNGLIYDIPVAALGTIAKNVRRLLKNDPENLKLKANLVSTLFIMQRFDEVIKLKITEKNLKELKVLSKKYLPKRKPGSKRLSLDDLANLIKSFRGVRRYPIGELMIAYDMNKSKHPNQLYLEPVKALLSVNNRNWQFDGFDYDAQNETLTMSSPNLTTLKNKPMGRQQKSVLRFLNIKKIIIAGKSPVQSLPNLNILKLKSLDISQSNIKESRMLQHPELSEVIINKTQAEYFKNNNSKLRVVIVPKEPK